MRGADGRGAVADGRGRLFSTNQKSAEGRARLCMALLVITNRQGAEERAHGGRAVLVTPNKRGGRLSKILLSRAH